MEYTIRELADLAGVSTRTLRWYDQIALLRPHLTAENGYRYYSRDEVDRLQQILFYRAIGVELAEIRRLLDDPSFDRMAALRGHLEALQAKRRRVDALISAVKRTIQAEEGRERIMDSEKFEAFKKNAVEQNEAKYGRELRTAYGDAAIDASNRRVMALTQEEYAEWKALGDSIRARLESAVLANQSPDSGEGRAIAEMHGRWLRFSWGKYDAKAHRGLVEMYPTDERFRQYYDAAVPGCAEFLRDAVLAAM